MNNYFILINKYTMYEKINILKLWQSQIPILVQEFDLLNKDLNLKINYQFIKEILTEINNEFEIKYLKLFYTIHDKDWIKNDLTQYYLLEKAKNLFDNTNYFINNDEKIYFIEKSFPDYWIEKLSILITNRIELKLSEIIFIQLSNDIVIYPHDDYGFWIINFWVNNQSIEKIKLILNRYWSVFFYIKNKKV